MNILFNFFKKEYVIMFILIALFDLLLRSFFKLKQNEIISEKMHEDTDYETDWIDKMVDISESEQITLSKILILRRCLGAFKQTEVFSDEIKEEFEKVYANNEYYKLGWIEGSIKKFLGNISIKSKIKNSIKNRIQENRRKYINKYKKIDTFNEFRRLSINLCDKYIEENLKNKLNTFAVKDKDVEKFRVVARELIQDRWDNYKLVRIEIKSTRFSQHLNEKRWINEKIVRQQIVAIKVLKRP